MILRRLLWRMVFLMMIQVVLKLGSNSTLIKLNVKTLTLQCYNWNKEIPRKYVKLVKKIMSTMKCWFSYSIKNVDSFSFFLCNDNHDCWVYSCLKIFFHNKSKGTLQSYANLRRVAGCYHWLFCNKKGRHLLP